jgi:hypothetical protein
VASFISRRIKEAWEWIKDVATTVDIALSMVWNWLKDVAAKVAQGITSAWNWIQNAARRLAQRITDAWNWIQHVATRIGMAIQLAWDWLLSVAARIGMLIRVAWEFLINIASRVGMMFVQAWNWLMAVAAQLGMLIRIAWSFVENLAHRVGLLIVQAWNWLVGVALQLGMMLRIAWDFIQNLAARIGMMIQMAWNWIKEVAAAFGMMIRLAWNLIQAIATAIKRKIIEAFVWLLNAAIRLAMRIRDAWNFLVNLAKRLVKSILEAWDWYWNAPKITIETDFFAPAGLVKNRTNIGVGERVTFTGDKSGDWVINGGTPLTLAGSNSFRWTAPNRAATLNVKLTSGKYSRTQALTIVEPSSITARRLRVLSYARGRMGAGMEIKFKYHPDNVSFGNLESKEVSGPSSNVRGYFIGRGPLNHDASGGTGTDPWLPIGNDNEDVGYDTAAIWGYPRPWRSGGYDWIIPNKFKVVGEGGDGKEFTKVTQAFTMADATGKTKVTKGGSEVERTP